MSITDQRGQVARDQVGWDQVGWDRGAWWRLLLLLPVLGVVGGLFVGGVGVAIAQSLGMLSPLGESGPSWHHYRAILAEREFRVALRWTFGLAALATLLAAGLGTALALALRRLAQRSALINLILQIPLAIPHLSMAVFLITILAPSGLIARLFYHLGWIGGAGEFPELINDRWGLGIVIAYLLKELPFVTVMLLALLAREGRELEEQAQVLGASAGQRLRYVILPILAPAALSSSLMVFAFIVGAYETPYLLGRTWPAFLPVVAQQRYMDADLAQRPGAIAMAVLLSFLTTLLVWLYLRLAERWAGTERPLLF